LKEGGKKEKVDQMEEEKGVDKSAEEKDEKEVKEQEALA